MTSYRIYCLDRSGRISLADWIEAENDDDALAQAHMMKAAARKCEVWRGRRLLATLETPAPAAPPVLSPQSQPHF